MPGITSTSGTTPRPLACSPLTASLYVTSAMMTFKRIEQQHLHAARRSFLKGLFQHCAAFVIFFFIGKI